MLRNYLLIAVRSWVMHKLFTAINVVGLTVGLTCAVFITLFVRDELSYDRWIPGSDNIYRAEIAYRNIGQPEFPSSMSPFPMPAAMADQIPEVKAMARLTPEHVTLAIDDREFSERIDVVDPQFFEVIKLPLIAGDPSRVFLQPESVVISQSAARKYFGRDSGIIGKTLTINTSACPVETGLCQVQTQSVEITGIVRDLPHNTQLGGDVFIPNTSRIDTLPDQQKQNWGSANGYGYVLLAPGADPATVLAKLRDIIDLSGNATRVPGDKRRVSEWIVPGLTRFRDAHLTTDKYQNMTPAGSRATVYGFAVIGVLIVLVACFNFTNLAIARATLRAREISLRKVVGARRDQIVVQFLGEAVLMALAAFVLTMALIQPLLPSFDRLLGKPIAFHYFTEWRLVFAILAVAVVSGLLSGLYPAVVLSRFRPAVALRSSASQVTGSGRFRAVLVILQFAVSIGLAIGVTVVFAQISFARQVGLGFRKDDIVVIQNVQVISRENRQSFVNALNSYPGVIEAALSGENIPIADGWIGSNTHIQATGAASPVTVREMLISPQFESTYDLHVVAGRLLSEEHSEDVMKASKSINVVVNESAARQLGFTPTEAIGKPFAILDVGFHGAAATIVGVIDDLKMGGPQHPATASMFFYAPFALTVVSIRLGPEHLADTLAFIDKTWSQFVPSFAIQRYFLSDIFNKQFASDERQGTVFMLFVGIAIFIACLGLFGLAAFTAERRTKEIGLRKTFGAKTRHVVVLLLWQFSIPVLIANIVAWPLAYYYLHGWLETYADRISLNPLYFVAVGAAALLIAWLTVYVHAFRMARANPINALRYE